MLSEMIYAQHWKGAWHLTGTLDQCPSLPVVSLALRTAPQSGCLAAVRGADKDSNLSCSPPTPHPGLIILRGSRDGAG